MSLFISDNLGNKVEFLDGYYLYVDMCSDGKLFINSTNSLGDKLDSSRLREFKIEMEGK